MVAHQLRRPIRAREAKSENRVEVLDVLIPVIAVRLEAGDKIGVEH
jgi:hypothetical protein